MRSGSSPMARNMPCTRPQAPRMPMKDFQLPTACSIGASARPTRIEAAIMEPGEISPWIAR